MSSSFSWTDRVHIALNTCVPCLRRSTSSDSFSPHPTTPTATAPDDLRRLLVDPDVDTLSLHSTSHVHSHRSVQNGSAARGITLFGFHLFGRRPPPPIHLDHSDDALYRPTSTIMTFDSDATPLDTETVPDRIAAVAEEEDEEEQRRASEERRAKRRERREMRKLARALAADGNVAEEFEGFQGSGGAWPAIPQSFVNSEVTKDSIMDQDEEDQGADLDGVVYTRRRPGSNGGSDSRSSSDKYKARKKKSKSTQSSSRTADSTSIASPTTSAFFPPGSADLNTIAAVVSSNNVEQGRDFFDLDDRPQSYARQVSKDIFPSAGFGLRANGRARGAFLANTDDTFDGTF